MIEDPSNIPETTADAAYRKLEDAGRVIRGSRTIPAETLPEAITDAQCAEVIDQVKAYLEAKGMPRAAVARGIGYSTTPVSLVMTGKYPVDGRQIILAMDRWLERRRLADGQVRTVGFIETDVATKIKLAAQLAMSSADAGNDARIALVFGDAGCGKTMGLKAVARKFDGVIVTCAVADSAKGIAAKIAAELGIRARGRVDMLRQVTDALRGTGKLLIIDEIHALLDARDDNAFHTLRRLADETGCPQLWSASCDLIEHLRERELRREPLGQIISRICCHFHLTAPLHEGGSGGGGGAPLVSVEEILKMYASNELRLTGDAGRFLAKLLTNPKWGLLRTCTNLVATATRMNRGRSNVLTAEMLWQAAQFLFQESVLRALAVSVRDELVDMRLKMATA